MKRRTVLKGIGAALLGATVPITAGVIADVLVNPDPPVPVFSMLTVPGESYRVSFNIKLNDTWEHREELFLASKERTNLFIDSKGHVTYDIDELTLVKLTPPQDPDFSALPNLEWRTHPGIEEAIPSKHFKIMKRGRHEGHIQYTVTNRNRQRRQMDSRF